MFLSGFALAAGLLLSTGQLRNLDGTLVTPSCADGKFATVVAGIWGCGDAVGVAAWGTITGVLSAQSDLQTALNGKQAAGTYATGTGTANGTNTGDQTSVTGNAGTATALQNARTINGASFNGTANITLGNGSVLLAQLADMATGSLFYRKTAGSGAPEVQTLATLKTDLALVKADVGLGNADNTSDANKPVSSATQTALNLKANLVSPSFTTPALGVATGTSYAAAGAITSSSPTAGIGYVAGSGGAQTQATNKATTVVSNTVTTAITMNGAALAAGAIVSFTFTNSTIAATDQVVCTHQSAGTNGAYLVNARPAAGSASIAVRNTTAGSLSEAIVLRCSVYKAVSS